MIQTKPSSNSRLGRTFYVTLLFIALLEVAFISFTEEKAAAEEKKIIQQDLKEVENSYTFENMDESSKDDNQGIIAGVNIDLDKGSTFYNDIQFIRHLPEKREIHVRFKHKRRCQRPKLKGRLSGPYLAIIEWDQNSIFHNNTVLATGDDRNDILIGRYHVPEPGTFFLEIIVLFCENHSFWRNFTNQCMENPKQSRLTEHYARVEVLPQDNLDAAPGSMSRPAGYWKWNKDGETNKTGGHYEPLHTRFQPFGCFQEQNKQNLTESDKEYCHLKTSIEPISNYSFAWNQELFTNVTFLNGTMQVKNCSNHMNSISEKETVCLVGMSHSRFMNQMMHSSGLMKYIHIFHQHYLVTTPDSAKNMDFVRDKKRKGFQMYKDLQVDSDTNKTMAELKRKSGCSRVVLVMGYWAASQWGTPFLFREWEHLLRTMVTTIREQGMEPVILSLSNVGISERTLYCPSIDWVNHAIDGYNDIALWLSQQMNFDYIDDHFITGPVWDFNEDFMHHRGETLLHQCEWIISELLRQRRSHSFKNCTDDLM